MEDVTVKKDDLLEALRGNRGNHRELFLEAQVGFKAAAIEALELRLASARTGQAFDMSFSLPEPQDHTSDYDRAIRMVEMEVESTICLSERDFATYVMDDWGWRQAFLATSQAYTAVQ